MEKRPQFIPQRRLSWDELFMEIAQVVSKRSACLFHKIASVFVDENHRIISIGYNGPSTGDVHCNEVGCAKVHGNPITGELNKCRGAHSEMNAIINGDSTRRYKNSTLYITVFPCRDCMKIINNLGVKRIVYYEEYLRILDGSDGTKSTPEMEAWELAGRRGIKLDKYSDLKANNDELKLPEEKDIDEPRSNVVAEKNIVKAKNKPRW